jgi:hypothetical protein
MVIYLYPQTDEASAQDLERLKVQAVEPVNAIELHVYGYKSVRQVVRKLANHGVRTLVLPDDYHRHTEPIEHVKACAHHMGIPVMPLTRYLTRTAPAPATASVHANAAAAGVGANAVPAGAG